MFLLSVIRITEVPTRKGGFHIKTKEEEEEEAWAGRKGPRKGQDNMSGTPWPFGNCGEAIHTQGLVKTSHLQQ